MANNSCHIVGKLTKFKIKDAGQHKIVEGTLAAYNGQDADCPVYVQFKQWNPNNKTKKLLKRLDGEGRVCLTGRLRMDTWDDEETDEKVFRLYLLCDDRDGILEGDEPGEYEDDDGGKKGGKKGKGKKGGGKKKRGKKNVSKKKGKKGKNRRDEEEDEDEEDDDDDDGDDDDDWDEDD